MLTISEVSRLIGVSVVTLRRWDRSGILVPLRTLGNHRRYSWAQIGDYLPEHLSHIVPDDDLTHSNESPLRETYIYARVSSAKQKHDGNLDRQVERLVEYCHREFGKKAPIRVIHEYGSGLNPHRRGLWRLSEARPVIIELIRIREHLSALTDILSSIEESFDLGVERLLNFKKDIESIRKKSLCGAIESTELEDMT
ncbi:MAG: IS607 family transposase, partial [Promethearchaeota archaeon]